MLFQKETEPDLNPYRPNKPIFVTFHSTVYDISYMCSIQKRLIYYTFLLFRQHSAFTNLRVQSYVNKHKKKNNITCFNTKFLIKKSVYIKSGN